MFNSPANIILADDLNITLVLNEKKGGNHGKYHLKDIVEELIQVWDLNDLKPKYGHFTWSNQRAGAASMFARLYQFLVQSSLLDGNLIISSKILPKLSSNRHPIALLFEKELVLFLSTFPTLDQKRWIYGHYLSGLEPIC